MDCPVLGYSLTDAENLEDHVNFGPSVEVQSHVETLDELSRKQILKNAAQAEYDKNRTGVLSEGGVYTFAYWPLQLFETPSEKLALQRSIDSIHSDSSVLLNAQYEFTKEMILNPKEASATVALIPIRRYAQPDDPATGNYMTLVSMLSHPFSRGSSHITTKDSKMHPEINFNYLSHPLDLEILTQHTVQIERLFEHPLMSQILAPTGRRYPNGIRNTQRSEEDLKQLIKENSATNYHPCGTCVMATSELGGVVGADLFVHGVENLRVCDASIFPIIPRGNILSTVYAVAEKAAELIVSLQ